MDINGASYVSWKEINLTVLRPLFPPTLRIWHWFLHPVRLWEVKNKYGNMQANRLLAATENLEFQDKEILKANYLASAAERNAYWKKKPSDDGAPASGKNTQQSKDTPTLATGPDRKKGRKPYTGR